MIELLFECIPSDSGVGRCMSSLSHLGSREGRSQACLPHVPVAMQNIRKRIGERRSGGYIVSISEYMSNGEPATYIMGIDGQ